MRRLAQTLNGNQRPSVKSIFTLIFFLIVFINVCFLVNRTLDTAASIETNHVHTTWNTSHVKDQQPHFQNGTFILETGLKEQENNQIQLENGKSFDDNQKHVENGLSYKIPLVDEKQQTHPENKTVDGALGEGAGTRSPSLTPIRIQQYAYSNPIIQQLGCAITAVLMHPNLGKAAFAVLESVATFVFPKERVCILIQTSICAYQAEANVTAEMAYQHVIEYINEEARPLFKGMIQMGNVRVTVLNHTLYHLEECDRYHPNNPWLNYYFWNDYDTILVNGTEVHVGEFVPGRDSDLFLGLQTDMVLCTGLDASAWKEFSYVGAPWTIGKHDIVGYWPQLHKPPELKDAVAPPFPSAAEFDSDPKMGPIGNGGLTLRSRYWMQQVIDYCPHTVLSDLVNVSSTRTCFADFVYAEDVYFATLLRGLAYNEHNPSFIWHTNNNKTHTPLKLPTMIEAAYFAVESRLFREVANSYQTSDEDIDAMVDKLSWWDGKYTNGSSISTNMSTIGIQVVEDGRIRFKRLKTLEMESGEPIVSIGLHKPWWYGLDGARAQFMNECPHLKDVWP